MILIVWTWCVIAWTFEICRVLHNMEKVKDDLIIFLMANLILVLIAPVNLIIEFFTQGKIKLKF